MSHSDRPPLRRYRGILVWIDRDARRVRQGQIQRAILRARGLSLEFACEGRAYHVVLRPSAGHAFAGTWTQGTGSKQVSGEAECHLSSCGVFFGEPGEHNLKLEGRWEEEGAWDWVGKLQPLRSSDTA
jgi:hypothetical protein